MSEVTTEIEFSFDCPESEAVERAEALMKVSESLTTEQLTATADFIFDNPEAVVQIEKWVRNPPVWMRPFIPNNWKHDS